jgi:hypothetical protein
LYDATGKELPTSFKNGFCVEDLGRFVPSGVPKYTCDNQGISVGCYDKYDLNLPCQWIDITGLASGVYKLVVDVNWLKQKDNNGRDELSYTNNTATVCFQVARSGASATVTKMNCDTNVGGGVVPPSTTGVVTVYESKEYAGGVLSLNQGTYSAANLGALNLNISALTVMNGYQVRACRADGYCRTFTANTPFVGSDMDNQIVSLEVSTRATILPTCNTAVTTSITAASCADNDGKATFNITGGTPPYQIAIDASTIYSSTFTIGGLKAGTHTVSVRDNIGCIVTQSFVVSKNCTVINCNNVIISLSPTAATCAGNDGILDKLVLGGTPPYLFSVDGKTPQADPSFSGLSVGAHYVIVKDNVGCNVRKDFTIVQDCVPICAVTATAQPTNVTCAGNDGKVTITAGSGTAPYSYAIDSKAAQTGNSFSSLTEGNHNVVVTDAKGCTKAVTFTIGRSCITPVCTIVATAQLTESTCADNDGKITITASGGSLPYKYAIASSAWQASNVFLGLAAKTYSIQVRDSMGCVKLFTTIVTKRCTTTLIPTCAITATAQPTNVTCAGNDGKVTISAAGGTAPYTYALDGKSTQSDPIFYTLAEGIHTVVVADAKSCTKSVTFTIGKTCTPCAVTATAQTTAVTCAGNDGKINLIASGGTAPYQYAMAGTTWQTNNVFTGLTNKSYDFWINDSKGCNFLLTVAVTKNCVPCALTVSSQVTAVTCAGNDGKITITAAGGTAPYKYTLTGSTAQTTNIFSGLTEKTYQILVSDSKGCNAIATAIVSKTCAGFDPNKCYRFVFTHSGQVLDIRSSSTWNGGIVQQYAWHGGRNQIWKIQSIGNGYHKIVSTNSSKVLEVPNFSTSNTVAIRQWDYVGGNNQQWQIIATSNNTYKVVNRHSGKVTDIPGTNITTSGLALQQNTDSNQADQRFRIEEVTCPVVREDAGEITQVTIFPNPSKKEVNIRMDEAFAERLSDIKIYDVLGNVILQTDTRSQEISFEILKDGFYIIALASKNGSVVTKKLIISNKEE